ncbi:MAG: hypothetical protein LBQ10_04175, partial [Desulfovibrio sp.]|nr:hypothetical protein [Desulfovibrio sp.]
MFELLHMKHVIFCLSLVVAIAAAPSRAASFQARVVSVADGDSFTALDADNRQVEIRLYGISCPEKNQPYG